MIYTPLTNQHFVYSRLPRDASNSMKFPHSHSFCELYYLISGMCTLRINQTIYTLTPGTLIFIPSGVPHKTTYDSACVSERLTIEFSPDYVAAIDEEFGEMWLNRFLYSSPMHILVEARSHIEELMASVNIDSTTNPLLPDDGAMYHSDIFTNCMRKLRFQELIINILRNNTRAEYVTEDEMQISDISVSDAKKFIDENYSEALSLDSLAQRYRLNPSYFSNKFKSINGIGFKEYLNNVRIIHAEKLLLETSLSITDIALQCGYESSNYFGDIFRKVNGVSPSQFRKVKGNV